METGSEFRRGFLRGQAAVEYVLALAGIVLVIGVFGYLVSAALSSAERTTNLVESDYP